MRKILLFLLVPMVSGCTTVQQAWEGYWLPPFDNHEYAYAVELRTMSEIMKEQCQDIARSKVNATAIHNKALEFYNYSRELEDNQDVESMAKSIAELTVTFRDYYSNHEFVGANYCHSKFNLINLSSQAAQRAMARKKR